MESIRNDHRRIMDKYDEIQKIRGKILKLREEGKITRMKNMINEWERAERDLALLQQFKYKKFVHALKLEQINMVTVMPRYEPSQVYHERRTSMSPVTDNSHLRKFPMAGYGTMASPEPQSPCHNSHFAGLDTERPYTKIPI